MNQWHKTVILDGNIYNALSNDAETRTRLVQAIDDGLVRVIATPVVVDELVDSPFGGVPTWFPIDIETESVAVVGFWRIGMARLGDGEVFTKHRGESNNTPDAILADSANDLADILVTNDRRCRKRLSEISSTCEAIDYAQFRKRLCEVVSPPHA